MDFSDPFKPYSLKLHGGLEDYLRAHDGSSADNHFYGPECFYIIKEKGWMMPGFTCVRVARHPVPDIGYLVNSGFKLESVGPGERNMSLIGAEKGVYDPRKVLKGEHWSISGLKLWD